MLDLLATGAGAVGAVACCLTSRRWRARVLAISMVLSCIPVIPLVIRLLLLIGASVALAVGLRAQPHAIRHMNIHRSLGGVLMFALLAIGAASMAGEPGMPPSEAQAIGGGHGHGTAAAAPSLIVTIAVAGYLAWTLWTMVRDRRHESAAALVELGAMGLMLALMTPMVLG